jgi:hypothetical protein
MNESEYSALSTDKLNKANGSKPVEENKEMVEGWMAEDINIIVVELKVVSSDSNSLFDCRDWFKQIHRASDRLRALTRHWFRRPENKYSTSTRSGH